LLVCNGFLFLAGFRALKAFFQQILSLAHVLQLL